MADEGSYSIPSDFKKLRACLCCKLIKTETQFNQQGCDNCPSLNMRGHKDTVLECSSQNFTGLVAQMSMAESWVARREGLVQKVPGVYAMQVLGDL
eukprot:CAMPEP_0114562518 /NCGR_PEP_ID=MMETSP0114-20121206/12572_1 /TAXON_ID=31324 /ORGANISM="Goniomonas sp, Strain m" /LENGTH=95 /DNA_ID=CAMNT_0001748209 /DNA_START=35 /DNA_END=318 /DNA_ORIENTATION=+